MFKKAKLFLENVQTEFKRVQWPVREATLKSTSIVMAISFVIAVYLGIADLGLSNLMKLVLSN